MYQTINNSSANVVTIVNNPSSLREDNELPLHDGFSTPGKFESPSSHSFSVVNIISVPPKIWQQNLKDNYKHMVRTDVDKDLYTFKSYGKTMKHADSWIPKFRSGVILWNSSLCQQKNDDNFNIGSMTDDFIRKAVLQIIMDNWDFLCEVGAVWSMLDVKFCIDTGNSNAIYCRQSKYGDHIAKIIY